MKMADLPGRRHLPPGDILRETGVPLPKSKTGQLALVKIFDEFEGAPVGTSILIASDELNQGAVTALRKKFGGRFTQKTYKTGSERGYTRIWRIE